MAKKSSDKKAGTGKRAEQVSFTQVLRAGDGFDLSALDPRATPGFDGDKAAGEEAMVGLAERLSELQERLYAESRGGGTRSVLLLIQGMKVDRIVAERELVGADEPATDVA